MNLKPKLVVVLLTILVLRCDAYQTGKGKFESYNGNRYTEAKSMDENNTKAFLNLNLNRNRPPAHDTPASPCSCSKSIMEGRTWLILLCKSLRTFSFDNFFSSARASFKKSSPWPWSRKFLKSSLEFYGNCDSKIYKSKRQNRKKLKDVNTLKIEPVFFRFDEK